MADWPEPFDERECEHRIAELRRAIGHAEEIVVAKQAELEWLEEGVRIGALARLSDGEA